MLTAECVEIHYISMHEYSIQFGMYEFEVTVETEVEILWNDGTSVVVDSDYRYRTDQSFSVLRLIGRKVLSCHFDHDESLVFKVSGGDYIRFVAKEPVESFRIEGIDAMPLLLFPQNSGSM